MTDISALKDLKNLELLYLGNNQIIDISVLKYLNNLEILGINELKLESDQIQYIKFLKNLKKLSCDKGFKDMKIIKQLNNSIKIYE